ncbi:MAG: tRNA glutamyl-Q synthetase [Opitutales bacterium]|nr:tRNA glutamyl-Q synthetase [Opitutales bacterium]
MPETSYCGRIAPTPSGYLHAGHIATFSIAWERARAAKGRIVYRCDDLDRARCKPEYDEAARTSLKNAGLDWDEGPDLGGPNAPYLQSERQSHYLSAWHQLRDGFSIYPSPHSRKDVREALSAPHPSGREPIFPAKLRAGRSETAAYSQPMKVNWRFRVPDGTAIRFKDGRCGMQTFVAGKDFGDFLVWRKDGYPSYELATVVDDHQMAITEVVRGEDLLLSTARQILLYKALGWRPPAWFHTELIRDEAGNRLAKRQQSKPSSA